MTKFVSVTGHPLSFRAADGTGWELPVSGVVLNAKFVDTPAGTHATGITLVRTRIEPEPEALVALARLEAENPGALIVGSLIAAQGFPGRVVALIAAPGFERKPPHEKRMLDYKFTTF